MPFSQAEKEVLLAAHLVGPTVVQRLEEIGFEDLATLREACPDNLCRLIAEQQGSKCWSNAPRARQAICNAIEAARNYSSKL
jgi:hypothetical protein